MMSVSSSAAGSVGTRTRVAAFDRVPDVAPATSYSAEIR